MVGAPGTESSVDRVHGSDHKEVGQFLLPRLPSTRCSGRWPARRCRPDPRHARGLRAARRPRPPGEVVRIGKIRNGPFLILPIGVRPRPPAARRVSTSRPEATPRGRHRLPCTSPSTCAGRQAAQRGRSKPATPPSAFGRFRPCTRRQAACADASAHVNVDAAVSSRLRGMRLFLAHPHRPRVAKAARETEGNTALPPHAFTGRESLARTRRLAHRPARFRQPRPGLPSAAARSSVSRRCRRPSGRGSPRHRRCASVCRWRYRRRDFQRYRWKSRQRLRPLSTMPPPAGRVR